MSEPGERALSPVRVNSSRWVADRLPGSRWTVQEFDSNHTFSTFVEGRSNEHARAAALQVARNAGESCNPLLLYGGAGLGKTHRLRAIGSGVKAQNPDAKVKYLNSQQFVQDMLLLDDIQFFAKKLRSQEVLFDVFNGLLGGGRQMVLTCDNDPRRSTGWRSGCSRGSSGA